MFTSLPPHAVAAASVVATARPSHLEGRPLALDPRRSRRALTRRFIVAMLALLLLLIPLAMLPAVADAPADAGAVAADAPDAEAEAEAEALRQELELRQTQVERIWLLLEAGRAQLRELAEAERQLIEVQIRLAMLENRHDAVDELLERLVEYSTLELERARWLVDAGRMQLLELEELQMARQAAEARLEQWRQQMREQARAGIHAEVRRIAGELAATDDPDRRQALLDEAAERLPLWYAKLDVPPPDTANARWLETVIWDTLSDEDFQAALADSRKVFADFGIATPLPENPTRRQLLAAMGQLMATPPDEPPLGVGERVEIRIHDLVGIGVETVLRQRINEEGEVNLPLVEAVEIAGLTEPQAEAAIVRRYREAEIIQNAQVSLRRVPADEADDAPPDNAAEGAQLIADPEAFVRQRLSRLGGAGTLTTRRLDLDGDGVPDLTIQTSFGLSNAGSPHFLFRSTQGGYEFLAEVFAHPLAMRILPPTEDGRVRLVIYHRSNASEGTVAWLVQQGGEFVRWSTETIHPGDGGTDAGRARYAQLFGPQVSDADLAALMPPRDE